MDDFKDTEHYQLLERAFDLMSDWQTVGDDIEDRLHVARMQQRWEADYYDWEEALHKEGEQ